MSELIDLNAERNKRAQPDPEFVSHDDYGRPLYTFLLSYDMDGKRWSTQLWAYDMEDARKRVAAMRLTLAVDGQLFANIPA